MRHTPTSDPVPPRVPLLRIAALAALLAIVGCAGGATGDPPGGGDPSVGGDPSAATGVSSGSDEAHAKSTGERPATARAAEARARRDAAPSPADPLRARDDLPEERRLLIVIDGESRIVDRDAALAAGYTPVDLRDTWVPYIFKPMVDEDGNDLPNRYRRIFIGLANDQTDGDGLPLPKGEDNYLEVFGIPPSLGVLRGRFLGDAAKTCYDDVDFGAIGKVDRITNRSDRAQRKHEQEVSKARAALAKAMKEAEVEDYAALLEADAKYEKQIELVERSDAEKIALDHLERRLDCDGHNNKRFKHKKGKLDQGMRLILRRFQRKHMLYEHTNLRGRTMQYLARRPVDLNHASLVRALTERVVAATGVIEDGSTQGKKAKEPPTYTGMDGKSHPIRNLVEEFTQAAVEQLGLDTPEKALAFFQRHSAEDLKWLQAGVKFPPFPEYYAPHMELEMVVNRGDVWYDPPFNEEGKPVHQSRGSMPRLSLFTNYNNQRIRLIHWPTTIGGWREDQAANGYLYYKYKGSDVGERVIRQIIAGPTWVPPESTPLRSLAKRAWINGKPQGLVNYAEMGPGYLSAYGLVAGYFVIPGKNGDVDRGIRAHGSSDYMSIFSAQRFSHGCHRLINHHAVRMYGFTLNHRNKTVTGDVPINHQRQFLKDGAVYDVRLPSRGFRYVLDPPLPVEVTSGRIRGSRRKPIEGFVEMPGQRYPAAKVEDESDGDIDPESRTGGGGVE